MTMKTVKITKYVTSDGKEFIGSASKGIAQDHEKFLQSNFKDYDHELNIAKILGEEVIFSDWELKEIMDGSMDIESDFHELMDRLFASALCSTDIETFREMADMIRNVIDDLGGITVVRNLYGYANKNLK